MPIGFYFFQYIVWKKIVCGFWFTKESLPSPANQAAEDEISEPIALLYFGESFINKPVRVWKKDESHNFRGNCVSSSERIVTAGD